MVSRKRPRFHTSPPNANPECYYLWGYLDSAQLWRTIFRSWLVYLVKIARLTGLKQPRLDD